MHPNEKRKKHCQITNSCSTLSIGLSTGLFGARPPVEDDFRQLQSAQIDSVEIRIKAGYVDISDHTLIHQMNRWVNRHNIDILTVHGPSGFPGVSAVSGSSGQLDWLGNPDESIRKMAVKNRCDTLEAASLLGARQMIVEYECYDHAPYWPHGMLPSVVYPQSAERWRQSIEELLETAQRAQVKLAIENIDGLSCVEQSEAVQSWNSDWIGLCFDSSHASYDMDLFFSNLSLFEPNLLTTHLSDNDGLSGQHWQDRHWTPFWGVVDWQRLIHQLVSSGYNGCLMLEVLNREKRITDELLCAINKIKQLATDNMETN